MDYTLQLEAIAAQLTTITNILSYIFILVVIMCAYPLIAWVCSVFSGLFASKFW